MALGRRIQLEDGGEACRYIGDVACGAVFRTRHRVHLFDLRKGFALLLAYQALLLSLAVQVNRGDGRVDVMYVLSCGERTGPRHNRK